jgi:hypothetical protein
MNQTQAPPIFVVTILLKSLQKIRKPPNAFISAFERVDMIDFITPGN